MKKLTALISAFALLLSLCACSSKAGGTESKEDASPEPEASAQAVNEDPTQDHEPKEQPPVAPEEEIRASGSGGGNRPAVDNLEPPAPAPGSDLVSPPLSTSAPAPKPDPAPVPPPEPEPPTAADPKAAAQDLIGHPVSELYAAIGKPISSDYAPGCIEPDSEDGELVYSGFTVYTVRTAAREYIYDVL